MHQPSLFARSPVQNARETCFQVLASASASALALLFGTGRDGEDDEGDEDGQNDLGDLGFQDDLALLGDEGL